MAYQTPPNPTYRTLDWAAIVRRAWGREWKKPETAYEFGGNRKFESSDRNGGPYKRP